MTRCVTPRVAGQIGVIEQASARRRREAAEEARRERGRLRDEARQRCWMHARNLGICMGVSAAAATAVFGLVTMASDAHRDYQQDEQAATASGLYSSGLGTWCVPAHGSGTALFYWDGQLVSRLPVQDGVRGTCFEVSGEEQIIFIPGSS